MLPRLTSPFESDGLPAAQRLRATTMLARNGLQVPQQPGATTTSGAAQDQIYFKEVNKPSDPATATKPTIVLLHGAFCSHREWDSVVLHLESDYHLIIPDLPQHSQSRKLGTPNYTTIGAADAVADVVRKYASNGGQAHIVGLSLGGFVAQEMVRRQPQVILSVFVTGATPFTEVQKWFASRAGVYLHWGVWLFQKTGLYTLASWKRGLVEHEALKRDISHNNNTKEVAEAVYGDLTRWGWDEVKFAAKAAADAGALAGDAKMRILVCAGGQGDDIEGARKMARIFRLGGGYSWGGETTDAKDGGVVNSQAFVVRNAIHAWDLQFPEIFALGVRAWVENESMPVDFELLA